jgi:hypothetical protein
MAWEASASIGQELSWQRDLRYIVDLGQSILGCGILSRIGLTVCFSG